MTHFFISYSRADRTMAERFKRLLERQSPGSSVFLDTHSLYGGQDWWEQILDHIERCDIFFYLLSNDSVQSDYCRTEFEFARQLRKPVITIQIRDRTTLTGDLSGIEYVNMSPGEDEADAMAKLGGSIQLQLARKKRRPISRKRPAKPERVVETPRPVDAPPVKTPPVEVVTIAEKPWWQKPEWIVPVVVAVISGVFLLISVVLPLLIDGDKDDATPTNGAQQTDSAAIVTADTPTLSDDDRELTVQAEVKTIITEAAGTAYAHETETPAIATAHAQMTVYAQMTHDANQTATATLWTLTPTPDARQTAESRLTETQAWIDSWTPTHTPIPRGYSSDNPVTANNQWTPVTQTFDGVEMVLVPAGCFEMGSTDFTNAQPVHEQCFDAPFWIDKYEVTNAQYRLCVAAGACPPPSTTTYYNNRSYDNHPVVYVDWFQAKAYAAWRGTEYRLPTEAEWEYAARGPDNLVYPWGNTFVGNNVVYYENSGSQTANVGSRPGGVSWVGAYDLSGNVWEWVSTIYRSYPYSATDGRESSSDTNSRRVLRGGSWNNFLFNARAVSRFDYFPVSRFSLSGFRVCRPPSL